MSPVTVKSIVSHIVQLLFSIIPSQKTPWKSPLPLQAHLDSLYGWHKSLHDEYDLTIWLHLLNMKLTRPPSP